MHAIQAEAAKMNVTIEIEALEATDIEVFAGVEETLKIGDVSLVFAEDGLFVLWIALKIHFEEDVDGKVDTL